MSTAADMLTAQIVGEGLRASDPAVYRFEAAAVTLGTTRHGKPPKVTVRYMVLLFAVSVLGFVLMLYGLHYQETRQPPSAVRISRHG